MGENIDSRIHLYCEREERLNTLSHAISAVIALVMLVLMAAKVAGTAPLVKGAMLSYSICTMAVYTASAVYHGTKNIDKKIFWQKIDHSMVSLIIAGTAAPALLVLSSGIASKIMLALVAAATIANIVLNLINVKKYKKHSLALYLAAVVFIAVGMTADAREQNGGFWILFALGFAAITAGSVFYMQKSKKYTHFVWHIADITTSVLHFMAFYFFVL